MIRASPLEREQMNNPRIFPAGPLTYTPNGSQTTSIAKPTAEPKPTPKSKQK